MVIRIKDARFGNCENVEINGEKARIETKYVAQREIIIGPNFRVEDFLNMSQVDKERYLSMVHDIVLMKVFTNGPKELQAALLRMCNIKTTIPNKVYCLHRYGYGYTVACPNKIDTAVCFKYLLIDEALTRETPYWENTPIPDGEMGWLYNVMRSLPQGCRETIQSCINDNKEYEVEIRQSNIQKAKKENRQGLAAIAFVVVAIVSLVWAIGAKTHSINLGESQGAIAAVGIIVCAILFIYAFVYMLKPTVGRGEAYKAQRARGDRRAWIFMFILFPLIVSILNAILKNAYR